MTDRAMVESLLEELYAARVSGQLERLCGLFTADARLRIAGSGDGKPIAVIATGIEQIRPWLSMLVKTFRIASRETLAIVIDGERAAVHWRANIHSKITGASVPTELMDLFELRGGRIASYIEFFVPC
jgi:ketosteroid isomerase-like protein